MKLEDTVRDMISPVYSAQMKAEYDQLLIRIKDVQNLLREWDAKIDFTPIVPKSLLSRQLAVMMEYADILRELARLRDVDLTKSIYDR